jgi:hypothetical protein
MIRSQIYLTEKERKCLVLFSRETGRTQSDLVREAIDQYIQRQYQQKKTFTHILHETKGMWESREDISLDGLRSEWEKNIRDDDEDKTK